MAARGWGFHHTLVRPSILDGAADFLGAALDRDGL